jgi:transcriptional regulator with XRE-family HTH domain
MLAEDRDQAVGQALRRVRDQLQETIKDAAASLRWSSSKLSRIETGASRINRIDLDRLLDHYRADAETRGEIERALGEPFLATVALPESVRRFTEYEALATKISTYAAMVVPGSMQIPEYADAVIRATPENEDHLAEERLGKRLQRQAVFASSMVLDVVIDESVLRRKIGGSDVMHRQIRRLQEFVERPETSVRVLPLDVGAHPALAGAFYILDFPDNEESRVFCDGLTGGVLRSRADDVHRYRACFEALKELALSVDESVRVLESAI